MNPYHRHPWVLAVFVAGLGILACQGRDAEKQKEQAKETAREIGEEAKKLGQQAADKAEELAQKAAEDAKHGTIASARYTLEIKAALMADRDIDASGIDVDTDAPTKTVVLKGTVPTAAQKRAAERVAHEKAEGYRVRNLLTVVPKASKT